MKSRVFKLQRSIIASGPTSILAYDENQEYRGEFPMDDALRKLMGRELKIYVHGHIDEAGKINVSGIARGQKW